MHCKIILVSDDSDFFEYIIPKFKIRKSDELFEYNFSAIPDKIHMLSSSVLIVNAENNHEQVLQLLDIVSNAPVIVFEYNYDEDFKIAAYKKGMYAYITVITQEQEIDAKFSSALRYISSVSKSSVYRKLLVDKSVIKSDNDVFLNFNEVLDNEIANIKKNVSTATLLAISPDEKTKYLIQPHQIETVIINNIRNSDILMNYSHNKYFLLLNNTDINTAKTLWKKISSTLPARICAGFTSIDNKNRQQAVNDALNSLHNAFISESSVDTLNDHIEVSNFKHLRQEFDKNFEQVVLPVFYHIQQKYNDKLFGIKIKQNIGNDGCGYLYLNSDKLTAEFKIACPGFSAINIDIKYILSDNSVNSYLDNLQPKRITLDPEQLEAGILQDILEEFVNEFKSTVQKEL